MNTNDRKKITVVSKYASENFSESDWYTIGQLTGKLDVITGHSRLIRSLSFGDEDYDYCVAEVINTIFTSEPSFISDVIDHFDIDLWYEQKEPDKYKRIFIDNSIAKADFWKHNFLKLFISHLSSNKNRISVMKKQFAKWGISAFIAHEDIEPSREWRDEVEVALETMDVMIAIVEPKFKESEWCCQEVGFALGRKIDIIPLRAGMDPFGFFGKYQGIQIKGQLPDVVADEVAMILLRKPKHRKNLLQSMGNAFATLNSEDKISNLTKLDNWNIATDEQVKDLLERSSLSNHEKNKLAYMITKVSAFKEVKEVFPWDNPDNDVPF